MEKEEEKEEGNNGKDTDGDQCQLSSNCKSNDGENDPIVILISPAGFINQS